MNDATDPTAQRDADQVYNPARYWDYILGGYYNFEADRKVGDRALQAAPDIRLGALANRAFLRRAVRLLAHEGIAQFVDLGSGLPTVGPVHETAQGVNPSCHTVYVDNDPVAVTHSQSILNESPGTYVIEADIRNIQEIFGDPGFGRLIDVRLPIGVLMVSVLHFIKDDSQAQQILRELRSRVAPGSYVVISHYSLEDATDTTITSLKRISSSNGDPTKPRSSVEISSLFEGFELLEPGVVRLPLWRPEGPDELLVQEPERCLGFAGVGRKK